MPAWGGGGGGYDPKRKKKKLKKIKAFRKKKLYLVSKWLLKLFLRVLAVTKIMIHFKSLKLHVIY
jgi:hypothetical protein